MKQSTVLSVVEAIENMLPNIEDNYSLCRKLSSIYNKLSPEAQGYNKDREKINTKFGIPITIFTSETEISGAYLVKHKEKEELVYTYQIDTSDFLKVKDIAGVVEVRNDQYRIPTENIVAYTEAVDQLLSTDIEFTDKVKGSLFDGVKMPKFGVYIAMIDEIIED
jgi:hypothetical protein